jgi:cytochrome o ubiquinol oxidase subunit 2
MLTVAIPLLVTLYIFAWRYRAGNKKRTAKYEPEHTGGAWKQLLWWVIPAIIIVIISVIDWQTTHALDPFKPIVAPPGTQTLEIQVIALPWKWLFIYPAQDIATVNYIAFPVDTPVHFDLTADAPMSSFWIPELGSQIYAMAAMQTQLNLLASTTGAFQGKDTEINGEGYAGMTFEADSVSQSDFNDWVANVKAASTTFTMDDYNAFLAPSSYTPTSSYSAVAPGLYGYVLMKYMIPTSTWSPSGTSSTMENMPGMSM